MTHLPLRSQLLWAGIALLSLLLAPRLLHEAAGGQEGIAQLLISHICLALLLWSCSSPYHSSADLALGSPWST